MPEPITQQDGIAQALIDRITYLEKEHRRLKKVISNNKTSGKITLPKSLVGKEVYIVIPEENE